VIVIAVFLSGCISKKKLSNSMIKPVLEVEEVSDVQQEVDDIFSLLVYSLVFRDWQSDSVPRNKRRGYNIGALLVNKENMPVYYGLNCINSTENATQHGEVRAITGYLEKSRSFDLSGFTVYTSLEPCVMCAGMITMVSVKRVVYGQRDVEYSKAFERLAVDTRPIGGFAPYPRAVTVQASSINYCKELDLTYKAFLESDKEKVLAKYLASDTARKIFESAHNTFLNYKVKHAENLEVYNRAISFFLDSK
jgi:tRNA(Arg) A34 adenosine deaminase TadA